MSRNILIIDTAECPAVHGWNQSHPTQCVQCGEVTPGCSFCWDPLQNMVWPSLFSLVIKGRLTGECSLIPAGEFCRIRLWHAISSATCCLLVSEISGSPALLVGMSLRPRDEKRALFCTFAPCCQPIPCSHWWEPPASMGTAAWLLFNTTASFRHLPMFSLLGLTSYFVSFLLKVFQLSLAFRLM